MNMQNKPWPALLKGIIAITASISAVLAASVIAVVVTAHHVAESIGTLTGLVQGLAAGAQILRTAAPVRHPVSLTVRTGTMSLAVHAVGTVATWLIARSIEVDVPVLTIAWVRSVGLLAAGLPVSIAGLGVREGLYVVLLGSYGVAAPEALALSLISFGVVVFGMGLLGAALELRNALPRWRTG